MLAYVNYILGAYYSLLYDETTNKSSKKELQIQIRYFSEKKQEVVSHHLQSTYVDHAKAINLLEHLSHAINEFNLQKNNLIMLGSDGPNVNKKVFSLMDKDLIQSRGKGLLNVGTCNIHICHNAFLKGNTIIIIIVCL